MKIKLVEFLYFYLMPEMTLDHPMSPGGGGDGAEGRTGMLGMVQRSPSKAGQASNARKTTRSVEEKQAMLGRFLPNVDAFVEELGRNSPFGSTGTA